MTPDDRYYEQARILDQARDVREPLWQLRDRSARLRLHRALWHLFLTFGVCTFALGALVATAMWRYL
ncbi:MAG: hypothetical protein GY788_11490 [bacterium]|nr:hypothetical protein [bacterium]